ncbi:DUF4876 domain-containing protein [Myroides pelagicus]|uniref:DUF4876 domain-containing protein n=1 Tax=Myroides pelagicus TaxID=270914 RepID=A0A7K1GN92_9FLAO|nr:DUF4876 domain-containing protein [Myroides pelagicus]MTH30288.1 DUF4876 domain-containing protein [Myroides pelagicus]
MKKYFTLLALSLFVLVSCSKEDAADQLSSLTIALDSETVVEDYSTFTVILKELESGQIQEKQADKVGKVVFNVPKGSFSVQAEDLVDNAVTMSGQITKFTVAESQMTLSLPVDLVVSPKNTSFVLDELYFNGAKNGYSYTYYEQYFTIRNISDKALYADGLSFGVAGDFSSLEVGDAMSKYLPNEIVISQFYTIPGDGKTYKVEPNESLVIAFSAINHNEKGNQPNSLDLSGADLEIYVEGGMTVDNPAVDNVIVNHSIFQAFHWQYSGAAPMILFRLPESADKFIAQHTEKLPNPASMGTMIQDYLRLPTEYVLDAVETGMKDEFYHKVLPESVDRGTVLIDGSSFDNFNEQFVQRKPVLGGNGEETVADTNNSSADFIVNVGGQKSYPKK